MQAFTPGQIISRSHRVTAMHENEIGTLIVDSAVHVHQDLASGLLKTVHEATWAARLRKRGLSPERQVPISIERDGITRIV